MDPILQQEEQRRLRVQLIWRLGFAVALIAGVLAVIAWLDREREAPTTPVLEASLPVRIAPPMEMASEAASEVAAEIPETEEIASEIATEETASEPDTASAIATAIPTTTPSATPTLIASRRTAPSTSPQPGHLAVRAVATPARPLIVLPQKPSMAEVVRPSALPRPSMPAHPPISASQYTVQAGSFLHASNAEKLLQQLQGAGIPAYLETRVQIGPFANKAEADAAMAKLRKMGISPVLNSTR